MARSPDGRAPVQVTVAGGQGAVVGDGAHVTQYFTQPTPAVAWPVRLGRPPLPSDAYVDRSGEAPPPAPAAVHTTVVTGDGGVGKSQFAAAIWRQRLGAGTADVAHWVTADTRSAVVAAYAEGALALGLGGGPDPLAAATRYLGWLAASGRRWLLVLDDLADPAHLRGLWPTVEIPAAELPAAGGPIGTVVVTTRRRDPTLFGHGRARVDLGVFRRNESIAYLLRRLPGTGAAEADRLAADVGDLPLAMAQASAYVLTMQITPAEYRRALADRNQRLGELMPADDGDEHERTVAAAWNLACERADALPPVGRAGRLAELAAVGDANGMPEAMLTGAPAQAHADARDEAEARRALVNLERLSVLVIDPAPPGRTVRMHALTQRAIRERLSPGQRAEAVRVAADALVALWPEIDRDARVTRVLQANARAVRRAGPEALWAGGAHPLLWRSARSLGESGQVAEAAEQLRAMLAEARPLLGADHEDVLDVRQQLAHWQGMGGDVAGAVAGYEALLRDRRRVQGERHPRTLEVRNSLGFHRGQAGDAAGALREFEALVGERVAVLGADHPQTLTTRHEIGRWQGRSGHPALAVELLGQAAADRERVLGRTHPETMLSRHEHARWVGENGDPRAAITLLEALLADRSRVLGPRHTHTFSTRHELGRQRRRAGDVAAAAADFERLVADELEVFGPDHPDTLAARHEVCLCRACSGDVEGGRVAFEELLADRIRVLGPDHPNTLTTRHNIAHWRAVAGDVEAAVAEFEQLLADRRRVHGDDHPHVAATEAAIEHWSR